MIQNNGAAAAAEAARKAAEEAARRAAEQAKKAAEAAQKAQAHQQQEASKHAAQELGSKDHEAEQQKPAGGLLGGIDKVAGAARDMAAKASIEKISPADAKKDLAKVQDDLKSAKTPQDVEAASKKAAELQGRAMVSGGEHGLSKDMAKDIEHLRNKTDAANKAVQKIDALHTAMKDPHQRAAATAELLTRPQDFQNAMGNLKDLGQAPVMKDMAKGIDAIGKHASPDALAKQLQADPDLSKYPPTMARDLAALQGSGHPELQKGIDAVGAQLLNRPGGVTYDQVKADPSLGKLMAGLQNSPDPALKGKLNETVKNWAKSSIDQNLDGKEGEDGVKDAQKGFEANMVDLANQTGLGPTIGQNAGAAAKEKEDAFKDTANKGKGFFDKAVDAVGGFLGDIVKNPLNLANPAFLATGAASAVAKVAGADGLADTLHDVQDITGKPGELVQKGLAGGLELAGKGLGAGFNLVGEGLNAGYDLTGQAIGGVGKLGAAGLDALGADGAAHALRDGSEFVEKAYDKVGDVTGDFTKGFGQGVSGTATGLGAMIKDPVGTAKGLGQLVQHPGEVAKAMWAEASQHGTAGAVGYVTANVLPMLVGGGETSLVGKLGQLGAESSSASLRTLGEGAVTAAKAGGKVTELSDFAGNLAKLPGVMGKLDAMAASEGQASGVFKAIKAAKQDLSHGIDVEGGKAQVKGALDKAKGAIDEHGGVRAAVQAQVKGKGLADLSRDYYHAIERFGQSPLGKSLGFLDEANKVMAGPLGYIAGHAGGALDKAVGVGKVLESPVAKPVNRQANSGLNEATDQAEDDQDNN